MNDANSLFPQCLCPPVRSECSRSYNGVAQAVRSNNAASRSLPDGLRRAAVSFDSFGATGCSPYHYKVRQLPGHWVLACVLRVLFCGGCADEEAGITTDMHEDFVHDHKHQHTSDDDHEHDHEDGFKGAHAHDHSHGHRHGEPLHGGRIVSIGHTHHKEGITHFHAEVIPLTDHSIRFHLLTESASGESQDFPIKATEIPGLISIKGSEAGSTDCTFTSTGTADTASEFALEIPESLREGDAFTVLIPKVTLNGNRQNISFSITRKQAENTDAATDSPPESSNE